MGGTLGGEGVSELGVVGLAVVFFVYDARRYPFVLGDGGPLRVGAVAVEDDLFGFFHGASYRCAGSEGGTQASARIYEVWGGSRWG